MKIKDHDGFIEEIEDRQSNTLWPDTMKNSSSVDEFLWKGSPNAPLVQRMGAWIFGLAFVVAGLAILFITHKDQSWIDITVSIASFFIGIKVFLSGFRKRKAAQHKSK